jgi:hypothetical protein
MTKIYEAVSPYDERGNDANDHRQDKNYRRRILSTATPIVGESSGFGFVGLSELRKRLSGPDYLVKPYLERDTTVVLFGESGAFKSFIALDLGLSVAYGIEYHGHATHPGAVFYLCGEGKGGIARRVEGWLIDHQPRQQKAPFYVSELPAQLIEAGNAAEVAASVQRTADQTGETPVLIIIDTLSTNIGNGDESNNADVARLLGNINTRLREQHNACVLLVHHVGHGDKDRERGAYALRANADSRILVKPHKSGCSLHSLKVKDGAPFPPVAFEPSPIVIPGLFDSEGELVTSLVLSPVEYVPPADEKALPNQQAQALAVLRDMKSATAPEWKEKLISLQVIKGKSHKQIFNRIKTGLSNTELVKESCGVFSPADQDSDPER